MQKHVQWVMATGALMCLALLFTPSGGMAAQGGTGQAPSIRSAECGWKLTNSTVVDQGQTQATDAGTLTQGYVVEAAAAATSPTTPVKKGKFRLTLTSFSPAADLPGQKAGTWYVQGKWSITDEKASVEAKRARHSPAVVNGTLTAELPFNPATDQGAIRALIGLPMSPNGGRWARGQGTFSGDETFVGVLQINAAVWPDVSKAVEVRR